MGKGEGILRIDQLLQDEGWDSPFFKKLRKNDTSDEKGNQGGPLIPNDLKPFFPPLAAPSQEQPTPSCLINATLMVNGVEVDCVVTRYQSQTRAAKRSPENRITDNIAALHGVSHTDDYLVIQRNAKEPDRYRLMLVSTGTSDYKRIKKIVGSRKWGPLGEVHPVTIQDLVKAENEETEREQLPFSLFEHDAAKVVSKTVRIARTLAFREILLPLYDYTCCVCGCGMRSLSGLLELDAAHIVPRSRLGADDARNGLTLCKCHHWAFDNGLFGIDPERRVYVPEVVLQIEHNASLTLIQGRPLAEAATEQLRANSEALAWHMEHVVQRLCQQNQA
jgi:putative restriction endonuclease